MHNPQPALGLGLLTIALLSGCSGGTTSSSTTPAGPAGTETFDNFEAASLGAPSADWDAHNGAWTITQNATAPNGAHVLQGSGGANARSTLLSEKAKDWGNFNANIKFNILSGDAPNGGGLAFHFDDSGNYIIIRWSPAEIGWHLFVVNGETSTKKESATVVQTASHPGMNQWVALHVNVEGNHVQAFDGATKVIDYTLEANDPHEGRAGPFVRGNSVVQFDAFEIDP